jgi:hypothetical protein
MPDGDKVHAHLAPIYQKVYKQLCEGQYGSEVRSNRSFDSNHLRAMLYQVNILRSLLNSVDPWHSLSKRYPILQEIADQVARREALAPVVPVEQLLQLYKCYILEWDSIQHIIGQRLLEEDLLQAAV